MQQRRKGPPPKPPAPVRRLYCPCSALLHCCTKVHMHIYTLVHSEPQLHAHSKGPGEHQPNAPQVYSCSDLLAHLKSTDAQLQKSGALTHGMAKGSKAWEGYDVCAIKLPGQTSGAYVGELHVSRCLSVNIPLTCPCALAGSSSESIFE